MITRKTEVSVIEIYSDKSVGIRLALLLVEDDNVLNTAWHRTLIAPEGAPAAVDARVQMAEVNVHLLAMGQEPVSKADIDRIAFFHKQAQAL